MYNSSNAIEQVTLDGVPFMARCLYLAISVCYKSNSSQFVPIFLQTTTTSLRFPAAHLEQQEQVFESAFSVLQDAVDRKAFPCACVAVTRSEKLVALKAFGR